MDISEIKEPGIYWAKSGDVEWWDLIIEVHGEFPFFKVRVWNRYVEMFEDDASPESISEVHEVQISSPQ